MKIFISWSGEKSREIAKVLRDWIPMVIQAVDPYVSSEDIYKGARWSNDVSSELETSYFGIICVTKENINAPWIHFEAGALSKTIEASRVCPLLFDVKISEISDPFKQFQATLFSKAEIKKLISSINQACPTGSLEDSRLETIFDTFWPELESKLNAVNESFSTQVESAPAKEEVNTSIVLEEILKLTREQHLILTDRNKEIGHGRYLSSESYLNFRKAYESLVKLHNQKNSAKETILPKEITSDLTAIYQTVEELRKSQAPVSATSTAKDTE